MIGEDRRTIAALSGILLILSIIFNPSLQEILSKPIFIFLGSISFPMYLLHGTFIRTILVWAFYGFLNGRPEVGRGSAETVDLVNFSASQYSSNHWVISATIICLASAALLVTICNIWKNTVDKFAIKNSRWVEEVGNGKLCLHIRYLEDKHEMVDIER